MVNLKLVVNLSLNFQRQLCFHWELRFLYISQLWDVFVNSEPKLLVVNSTWAQFVDTAGCAFTNSSVFSKLVNFETFLLILNLNCQLWTIFEPNVSIQLCYHWKLIFSYICQLWILFVFTESTGFLFETYVISWPKFQF